MTSWYSQNIDKDNVLLPNNEIYPLDDTNKVNTQDNATIYRDAGCMFDSNLPSFTMMP